jgi:hypothetical protein
VFQWGPWSWAFHERSLVFWTHGALERPAFAAVEFKAGSNGWLHFQTGTGSAQIMWNSGSANDQNFDWRAWERARAFPVVAVPLAALRAHLEALVAWTPGSATNVEVADFSAGGGGFVLSQAKKCRVAFLHDGTIARAAASAPAPRLPAVGDWGAGAGAASPVTGGAGAAPAAPSSPAGPAPVTPSAAPVLHRMRSGAVDENGDVPCLICESCELAGWGRGSLRDWLLVGDGRRVRRALVSAA